jgi:transposase
MARNRPERLDKHRSQVRAFLTDFRVPFDNNQAERANRMMKVQQKIAGPFRSEDGPEVFCRVRRFYLHRAQERRGCRRKWSAQSPVR